MDIYLDYHKKGHINYRISGIRADNFTPQKVGVSLCDKSYKKIFLLNILKYLYLWDFYKDFCLLNNS